MLYTLLIFILLVLDQASKYVMVDKFMYGETLPIVENFFHLTYVKNMGIAFGLFQDKTRIISVVTVFAVIGIAIYMYKELKNAPICEKLAYSFILSGALGNMFDRVIREFVVDMIDFRGIWQYVFNLADMWINIGVFLLIVDYFIRRKQK
ncbi:MAG: signal peptidase II [Fusobacteriaceae bacterium]